MFTSQITKGVANMYLTKRQHDMFRTLLMSFEIPFRTYIANIITTAYLSEDAFETEMINKHGLLSHSSPLFLKNVLTDAVRKHTLKLTYKKFVTATNSVDEIVTTDIDIPMVGALNLVTFALTEDFRDLYTLFNTYNTYCDLAEKYRYARNKLDHPGSRTLEDSHLIPVLSFVRDICSFLDDRYFLQKNKDEIMAEINALQTRRTIIPIEKNNFSEMPYGESRLVCRDTEIEKIKNYVYGKPEDLRKQHSCCIYGYGGVGKTALVLEVLKQIVKDILDSTTINEYSPKYIFFFSAKKRKLTLAGETGHFMEQQMKWNFDTAEQLIQLIHSSIGTDSFRGFHDEGLIVVDNLESLSSEEREKVKMFIETQTPSEMQFILTSRNSEEYETNYKLAGFEAENGKHFIELYNDENSLDLMLTDVEKQELLSLSKGNTLVLVLCLRRLSQRLVDISTLKTEFSSRNAWRSLKTSLSTIPSGAYEVIANFMYKDTFEHIEAVMVDNSELFYKVLEVFAVIENDSTDISTICLLTREAYPKVENIIDILCNYLIIEKNDTQYSLNEFAEKYIVGRFMPDAETYNYLSTEIIGRQREVRNALQQLETDIAERPALANIMRDWQIISDIDRISAANMYHTYGNVQRECNNSGKWKVECELEEFVNTCYEAERVTAHPFVKYQKARILSMVDRSNVLPIKHSDEIRHAYIDCIYAIKTIEQYASIQQTKSYASLLWLFGHFLYDEKDLPGAIRYLEDSKESFQMQDITDQEFYQCVSLLGEVYLDYYLQDRVKNLAYLRRARTESRFLQNNSMKLGKARGYANQLKSRLTQYGRY